MVSVAIKLSDSLYTLYKLKYPEFEQLEYTASRKVEGGYVSLLFSDEQWKDATLEAHKVLEEVRTDLEENEEEDWGYCAFDTDENFLHVEGNLLTVKILGV